MTRILSRSAEETEAAGRAFAGRLHPGDVVALTGTLGSGKTRFVAGVCDGLGVRARVTSPTFTLINEYPAVFGLVAHIDMYRVNGMKEVAELGIEEYFNSRCVCLIEWAETVRSLLPAGHFRVSFAHGASDAERTIQIEGPPGGSG
ncbi:MAG TPA: tRNA (adenosine(37)-N6)-threonylcarbamoyltransferase complex ATPase subunit type 1 TsaE [Bacteroidota bacterium]|nr:tRNA (adenosine(37)-N6)-threonylcarbamoyltransferase complex ATPase subunit type 1 TsaE [Bacteroidota bacterium]